MLTTISAGDTAWILISAALVFLMVPGFAFFYGGLFRKNNILSLLSLAFTLFCLVMLQWVIVGYSLTFGPDHNGWIGTLAWAGLRGVGAEPNMEYGGTVPHLAFMIYRGMIAVLPPIIFLSPFAERLKRGILYLIVLLWTTLISDPIMHWVWGVGGFLRMAGTFDFAGGACIYLTTGMAALAMALVVNKSHNTSVVHSQPPVALAWFGTAVLWFGGFGLIVGNALASPGAAANAFVMTQIAAVTSGLLWLLLDKLLRQELTPLGLLAGAVAGMAAASPAAGYVNLGGALGIGMGAGILGYASLAFMRKKFGHHDVLCVISLFGASGFWGMIATGLWSAKSANPVGEDGFFYGNPVQFIIQLKAALAIAIYSFGMSYFLFKLSDFIIGLQIPD